MDDITAVLLYFIYAWLIVFIIFGFVRFLLNKFLPNDTSLRDDSPADPDSSSADRRDTF